MSGSAPYNNEPLQFRPLESNSDQEIVWEMLMHAAHESDIDAVKTNESLKPYAQHFGQQEGDLGVVALTSSGIAAVGAAWVRALGVRGFATAHLKDSTDFQELKSFPELAIACLPEHQGKGVGSSLLIKLLQSARDKAYPGICLSCRGDNPALKLYERMGFVKVPGTEITNRAGGTSVTMKYVF